MKKRSSVYNFFFGIGILLIVAGIFLTLQLSNSISVTSANVGMVLFWLVLGAVVLYVEFTHDKTAHGLITGFYSIVIGIVVMLAGGGTPFVSYSQIWPVFVIGFGICFLAGGIVSRKKILAFFTVPSLILILLGVVFLLFSFDIITIPFVQFAARWWPVLLIFSGFVLVAVFYRRQKFAGAADSFFEDDDQQDYDDYQSF